MPKKRTLEEIRDSFVQFARREAVGRSATYANWATEIARNDDLLQLIATLPPHKQQPTLVLAAARVCGASGSDTRGLLNVMLGDWDSVREVCSRRSVQTNEPGRAGVLMPALRSLSGPVALVDLGGGAGLHTLLDRYEYEYVDPTGVTHIVSPPGADALPAEVRCQTHVNSSFTVPASTPNIVARHVIDTNPVDVIKADAREWLETLVWPEDNARLARLRAACRLAADEPPTAHAGGIAALPEVLGELPSYGRPVVVLSDVLAYVSGPVAQEIVAVLRASAAHWISFNPQPFTPLVRNNGKPSDIFAPDMFTSGELLYDLIVDGRWVATATALGDRLAWRGRDQAPAAVGGLRAE